MALVAMGVHTSINKCMAYSGTDHVLGPVLVFIDNQPNGIISSHILTVLGYKHFPRLMLNHTNPAYQSAISFLSAARQGSEIHRGLTITIMRFFSEVHPTLRRVAHDFFLRNDGMNGRFDNWTVLPVSFEGQHAADIASKMCQVDASKFLPDFISALESRHLSWLDLDIVIRGGNYTNEDELSPTIKRLLDFFGDQVCLPSSNLQRAPSNFAHTRAKSFVQNKDPAVMEREVYELVATERNYVARMNRLLKEVVYPMRETAANLAVSNAFPTELEVAQLFPSCLDEIVEANTDFCADVDEALEHEGVEGVARVCKQYVSSSFFLVLPAYLQSSSLNQKWIP